jgi:hypothetical protein
MCNALPLLGPVYVILVKWMFWDSFSSIWANLCELSAGAWRICWGVCSTKFGWWGFWAPHWALLFRYNTDLFSFLLSSSYCDLNLNWVMEQLVLHKVHQGCTSHDMIWLVLWPCIWRNDQSDCSSAGVYAGDPAKLSMKAAFGKVWRLEDIGGSIIGGTIKLLQERKKNPPPPRDP